MKAPLALEEPTGSFTTENLKKFPDFWRFEMEFLIRVWRSISQLPWSWGLRVVLYAAGLMLLVLAILLGAAMLAAD